MQAPIPDPFAQPAPVTRGPRPRALLVMIAISWLLGISTGVFGAPNASGMLIGMIMYAVIFGIDYALWLGQNWARIVTIVIAVIGLVSLPAQDRSNTVIFTFSIIEGMFSIVLICYLLLPAAAAFYRPKPVSPGPQAPS